LPTGGEPSTQQARNIWCNMAVHHLNLWMHALVALWPWNRSRAELCDRSRSPWDEAERRPSHADRRDALRRNIMERERSLLAAVRRLPRKILQLSQRLGELANEHHSVFRKCGMMRIDGNCGGSSLRSE